jgi:hypothetical protein
MAEAFGRAGQVKITGGNDPVELIGLAEFLRAASKEDKNFNIEMRKAAAIVAQNLLDKAKAEAATVNRSRQATEVMKGLKVKRNDRIPSIYLADKSSFVSKSFPNRRRGKRGGKKVTRGDVFFGAEFGGGKYGKGNSTSAGARSWSVKDGKAVDGYRKGGGHTSQFLRHRGRTGYFFWPTVRKEKQNIANEYLKAIQNVLDRLSDDRAAVAKARSEAGGVWNMTDSGMVFVKD